MPFNIDTFQQHLQAVNRNYSRFKGSSIDPLLTLLRSLGATVNPNSLAQLQPLWCTVPYAKQQKYAAAINYLKQFVPALADAIPVNPRMEYVEFRVLFLPLPQNQQPLFPVRFYHCHRLNWESSNGNMASLTNVGTRERVTHRANPAGPPFNMLVNAGIPMAFTLGATTNAGSASGYNLDDHSVGNPAIILQQPIVHGSVIADQVYEYTTDGTTWHPIPGAHYELEKGVRASATGGGPVFFFRKQSAPPHANPFHFEVEYAIGPPQTVPNNRVPVYPAGFATQANIHHHASRVVRLG